MNYKVSHTQVGPWPEGRIVSVEEVAEVVGNKKSHLDRLVRLGALVPVDEAKTEEPLGPGPENPQREPEAADEKIVDDSKDEMPAKADEPAKPTVVVRPAPKIVAPAKPAAK